MKKILWAFVVLFCLLPWYLLAQTTLVSPVRTFTCSAGQFANQLASTAIFSCATPTDTGITQLTGDVTAGPGNGSQAATLTSSNIARSDLGLNVNGALKVATSGAASVAAAADLSDGVNLAFKNVNQSYTKGQAVTPDSATSCGTQASGGTMTPDFANSNSCLATFGAGNLTIANPSNVKAGQGYIIALTQDGIGSRTVTWGSQYKCAGGCAAAIVLSTAGSAKDIISCIADTTTTINCVLAIKGSS